MYFIPLLAFLLQTAQMKIDHAELTVEIADTMPKRNQGLMGRVSLEEGEGMLFIYTKPEILSFWMKNTRIPLSIGFFDAEKRLFQIEDMEPPLSSQASLKIYKSHRPAQYALEVPQNWFAKHKIALGTKFTLHDLSK